LAFRQLALAGCVLAISTGLLCANVYVGPSGNDTSGNGAFNSPFKSLTKAWQTVTNGGTIRLLGGTNSFTGAALTTSVFRERVIIEPEPGAAVFLERPWGSSLIDATVNTRSCIFRLTPGSSVELRDTGEHPPTGIQSETVSAFRLRGSSNVIDGWSVTRYAGNGFNVEGGSANELHRVDAGGGHTGVRFQLGATGGGLYDSHVHHNDKMCRNNNNNSDFGGGGVALSKGVSRITVARNRIHNNRAVSAYYGSDGGAVETYAILKNSGCRVIENICYDNDSFMETGTNSEGNPDWTNGGVEVAYNVVYGTLGPGFGRNGIPHILRAAPDWHIHHNSYDIENGSWGHFQFVAGSKYDGTAENVRIHDNVVRIRFDNHLYFFNNTPVPPGTDIHHNLVFYTVNFNGNVYKSPTHGFTRTQLAAAQAATGMLAGDIWQQNPLFMDATNANRELRDYRLRPGSPAIGAASDGGNMGALPAIVAPVITGQPQSASVYQGSNVAFTVAVSGSVPLSFQWRFNTTSLLSGGTNSSYTRSNVQPSDAGDYSVRVSNVAGTAISSNASLTVIPPPPPNQPPIMWPIENRTVHAGATLTLTNSASDPNPGDTLTFSLDPGAPTAASIHPATGVFTWTTTDADTNAIHHLTVRVTDNGSPPMRGTASFFVAVKPRPTLQNVSIGEGTVTLTWSAIAGATYRVEYKDDLDDPNWETLGSDVSASGSLAATGDAEFGSNPQRFYRIRIRP
jgi:hypothetical protein